MPTTSLIVLSDLHLADNCNVLEGFRARQQEALEGLLRAALPGGSLGNSSAPRLILNGDTFDLLIVPPYPADGYMTPQIGLEKLARIAAAHEPFFTVLRDFLNQGGRVTFLIGNHDIELCFTEVRERVAQLIDPTDTRGERVTFCLDQVYRPAADVLIEHGNQYDFWNSTGEIWDEEGRALTPAPERIELPPGTRYMHSAALPLSLRYPYFERFDPTLGVVRQMAVLSMLDPTIVMEVARGVASMISPTYQPLQSLTPGDEKIPSRLFSQAMSDFMTFQQIMLARTSRWPAYEKRLYSPEEKEQQQAQMLALFFVLHASLENAEDAALRTIFQPSFYVGDEDTTRGMHHVLQTQPDVSIAIAGHTHIPRCDHFAARGQCYLNTATWVQRIAPPTSEELTPTVVAWLRQGDLEHVPLTDKTGALFAWVNIEDGQPSTARLCVWEGGSQGRYHVWS